MPQKDKGNIKLWQLQRDKVLSTDETFFGHKQKENTHNTQDNVVEGKALEVTDNRKYEQTE